MAPKILVTGAAGYIGGSIVAELISTEGVEKHNVLAAVRSQDQAEAVAKAGITVLQLDLSNEDAIRDAVAKNDIRIIINTTSAIDPSYAIAMLNALSDAQKKPGQQTHFIHTSGLSAFYPNTGWPTEAMKDTDDIFQVQKRTADAFPIRKTDVAVTEHAEAVGVRSYIVVPSTVYGRGTGEWNQLSIVLPVVIKASLEQKAVHRFPDHVDVAYVHISDLSSLYGLLVKKILSGATVPNGKSGIYLAIAHRGTWLNTLDLLAKRMYARQLISDPQAREWSNDEAAAKALGVPSQFLHVLWNSGGNIIPEKARSIGWSPSWDEERFVANVDAEIDDVVELGSAKSSLMDSLHAAAKG